MYKAVFLDLDGTLLDDEKNISNDNKNAIKYAQDKGAYVCICSGRQMDIVKKFKEEAGASRYLIFSNGAGIYDCNESAVLFTCNILPDVSDKLIDFGFENNLFIRIDTAYGRYLNIADYILNTEVEVDLNGAKQLIKEGIIQISFGSENSNSIDKLIEYIKDNCSGFVKVENRYINKYRGKDITIVNVINVSASKGNAIEGLCKYLKIDTSDVIAMGDDKNDASMMKIAGLGVAMANAEDEIKKLAKEITKSNIENGVAFTIYNKI